MTLRINENGGVSIFGGLQFLPSLTSITSKNLILHALTGCGPMILFSAATHLATVTVQITSPDRNQPKNSPKPSPRFPIITSIVLLGEFNHRSRQFSIGVYFVNSHFLHTRICIDILMRN